MLKRIKKLFGGRRPRTSVAAEAETRVPATAAPPPEPVPDTLRKEDIDTDAAKIVSRLVRHGHTAYLVGGCVRDLLLRRRPKDFDISTSATPREVKSLFRNSRIIGRRFKLVHVFFRRAPGPGGEKIIEVSTFRARLQGSEESVDLLITRDNVFGTAEEDARRRDFTVNALFYDLDRESVIDHAGGLADLRARMLRTIGDPGIRLREDPVRILRAVKFASRLDFAIEPAMMTAMRRHRSEILRSAAPRVLEEVLRILKSGASVPAFALLGESRVLEVLLPELDHALSREPGLAEIYLGVLSEFDRRAHDGKEPGTAVVLASLFLPLVPWQANAGPSSGDLQTAITGLVLPALQRLRVPRREADTVRRILLSIRKLVPGYRAKRFSRSALAGRDYFPDLLDVFRLHCRVSGHWAEALREWEELSRLHPPAEPPQRTRRRRPRGSRRSAGESPSGSGGGERGEGNRRRRGRRRGRMTRR